MSGRVLSILNLLALIVTVTVNGLASYLPINGQTTGEISDSFDVLITPAGYVFSIWGLIYLGLFAFAIFQLLPEGRTRKVAERIGPWFLISCVANVSWILLWHYNQVTLSLIAMVGLLISLIAIYLRLRVGEQTLSRATRWLVQIPFSLYLGWITVATIVNASVVLENLGWDGFGISDPIWTAIMLTVAVLVAIVVARTRFDVPYLLVLVWAFIGIGVKQSDEPVVLVSSIVATLAVVVLVLLAATTWRPLLSARATG